MLSNKTKEQIIHDSAREIGLDGHIISAEKQSDLYTSAERLMGKFSHYRNPHKCSYMYCDSVDVCFFIEREKANVTFTARWSVGSNDLSSPKVEIAFTKINQMLEIMQSKINEKLEENKNV